MRAPRRRGRRARPLWAQMVAIWPPYADYQGKTERRIPRRRARDAAVGRVSGRCRRHPGRYRVSRCRSSRRPGRVPADRRPAAGDRRARRRRSRRASATRRCSARPAPARRRRWRGSSRRSQPPGARDRAQQDARRAALQRVPRVLPRQRGRVLRLLLRLLPARGVRPAGRPLHREGLVAERRHRPPAPRGHVARCSRAATSSSSPRSRASTASARRRSTSSSVVFLDVGEEHDRDDRAAQAGRHPVRRATTRCSAAAASASRATCVEVQPAYSETAYRDLVLRRRGRADHALRPAHRRGARAARQPRHLPGDAVRDLEADDRARRRRDPRTSSRSR